MLFSRVWMVEADIDGSNTTTFGPRSTPLDGGWVTAATWNRWAADPLQVYWTNCTLSAVDALGTSRHLPLFRLTKW